MNSKAIAEALRLPDGNLGSMGKPRRAQSIFEAESWPGGTSQSDQRFVQVSPDLDGYCVKLGKPGKEAALDYANVNSNDMTPTIFQDGRALDWTPSFDELFREFQHMATADIPEDRVPSFTIELLACLLFRSAFMLDHVQTKPGSGCWRYNPPTCVLEAIEDLTPVMLGGPYEVPLRVYLHLIDALAWNEDVKYNPDPNVVENKGRRNTLLTCVNIIGVFLDRVSLVDFVGLIIRGRGVAPISQKAARLHFPLMEG